MKIKEKQTLDWNSLENTITLLYYFKEAKFNLKSQSGTNIKNSTSFNVKYTGKIIGEISQIDLKDIYFELVYDENDYAKLKLAIINDIVTNIKNNYSLELNKHYLLKESEIENLVRTISFKNAVNKSKTLFIHLVTNISKIRKKF
ncbi:hypothetical protein [Mycoplasmopsis columbina]|uniref:hypothetical protein n=1 Tax=Mycoplasmopsis columbina TaxID=114881 RepID=UPI0004A71828|nr:hypothetical protein [Mycoplasmopsis columbina]VEU76878.1 Uncharacterised protein [Mycoplasmopsis columbina]